MPRRGRRELRADRCIFCGDPDISEEHIFPRKWIAKLFGVPAKEKLGHRHLRTSAGAVDFDEWWDRKEADLVVYCVCRTCNSGWMNLLDERTQAIIAPMVRGEPTHIPGFADQVTLARWVTKLAFMFDYKQENASLPEEFAKRFRESGYPPKNAYIWIAASPPVPGKRHASGFTWTTEGRADEDWYLLTARVDNLVVQFLMPIRAEGRIAPDRKRFGAAVRQIWPPTYKQLRWPPQVLSELEYVHFAMTFILAVEQRDRFMDEVRDDIRLAASTEKG